MLCVSIGWHDTRLLLQHPPHRLTRVHDGNTTIVGSLISDSSAKFNGTTFISGTQFAGVGRLAAERSTAPPPKRAENQSELKLIFFSRNITKNSIFFFIFYLYRKLL